MGKRYQISPADFPTKPTPGVRQPATFQKEPTPAATSDGSRAAVSIVMVLGLTFAALLVYAHFADVQGNSYQRPLSMFRDYEPAWVGYALFGVLLAIGLETFRTAYRVQAGLHVAVYFFATAMLAIVAATPSNDSLHTTCALAAMFMLFFYHAALLYFDGSIFWLTIHLSIPTALMIASRLESYGIWQKGMILYLLTAIIVHQSLLAEWLPSRAAPKPRKPTSSERIRMQAGRR